VPQGEREIKALENHGAYERVLEGGAISRHVGTAHRVEQAEQLCPPACPPAGAKRCTRRRRRRHELVRVRIRPAAARLGLESLKLGARRTDDGFGLLFRAATPRERCSIPPRLDGLPASGLTAAR